MSEATMNTLYNRTGPFWWLWDAGSTTFEVFLYLVTLQFWKPDSLMGKIIKAPLAAVGFVVALPGTIPAGGLLLAHLNGG